jgi:hypothetical protein
MERGGKYYSKKNNIHSKSQEFLEELQKIYANEPGVVVNVFGRRRATVREIEKVLPKENHGTKCNS